MVENSNFQQQQKRARRVGGEDEVRSSMGESEIVLGGGFLDFEDGGRVGACEL